MNLRDEVLSALLFEEISEDYLIDTLFKGQEEQVIEILEDLYNQDLIYSTCPGCIYISYENYKKYKRKTFNRFKDLI